MHRSIRLLSVAAVVAATLGGVGGTARAETVRDCGSGVGCPDPDHVGFFSWTDDEYTDVCGINVHVVADHDFSYTNMQTHGPAFGVWYSIIDIETDATLTNEANGRYVTERFTEKPDHLLTAPIIYDNVHDITVLAVITDKLWDMDGNLIYHDAGSYQTEGLFDDGGDGVPGGGHTVTEPTIIRGGGLDPSDAEFCAAVVAALEG